MSLNCIEFFGVPQRVLLYIHITKHLHIKIYNTFLNSDIKMGAALSFLSYAGMRSLLLDDKESKIVMVGLDAAGKTTILFNLKLNEGMFIRSYSH